MHLKRRRMHRAQDDGSNNPDLVLGFVIVPQLAVSIFKKPSILIGPLRDMRSDLYGFVNSEREQLWTHHRLTASRWEFQFRTSTKTWISERVQA